MMNRLDRSRSNLGVLLHAQITVLIKCNIKVQHFLREFLILGCSIENTGQISGRLLKGSVVDL